MVAISEPALLATVRVYVVVALTTEGVPEIIPLSLFNTNPVGRSGVIDTVYSAPSTTGSIGVMVSPITKLNTV